MADEQAEQTTEAKAKPKRRFGLLSDGSILRVVFYSLLCIAGYVIYLDYEALVERDQTVDTRFQTREPVPLSRPSEDDQVRPYLPFTRPLEEGDKKKSKRGKLPVSLPKQVESGPMRFERGPRGRAVAAGRIVAGSAAKLDEFLQKQEGEVKILVLHSPGGNVGEALKMSRFIRKAKLQTEVPDDAYCASSCPLVFAGGVKRIAGKKAWIGVHQVYLGQQARGTMARGMSEAQKVTAACQEALEEMGVKSSLWLHAMRTPKDQLYFLTAKELKDYKLATRIGSESGVAAKAGARSKSRAKR